MALDLSFKDLVDAAERNAGMEGRPLHIPLSQIDEDHDQPRRLFSEEELTQLADSIRLVGILQPIVVRPGDVSGRYCIIMGARRYHAGSADKGRPREKGGRAEGGKNARRPHIAHSAAGPRERSSDRHPTLHGQTFDPPTRRNWSGRAGAHRALAREIRKFVRDMLRNPNGRNDPQPSARVNNLLRFHA